MRLGLTMAIGVVATAACLAFACSDKPGGGECGQVGCMIGRGAAIGVSVPNLTLADVRGATVEACINASCTTALLDFPSDMHGDFQIDPKPGTPIVLFGDVLSADQGYELHVKVLGETTDDAGAPHDQPLADGDEYRLVLTTKAGNAMTLVDQKVTYTRTQPNGACGQTCMEATIGSGA